MKAVIIQCWHDRDPPAWIARCMASVKAWALGRSIDYWQTDASVFSLCGDDYLAVVGDNKRSITNLCRLELMARAHAGGYDFAVWLDADVLVFDPERFQLPAAKRIAFARETWVWLAADGWDVHSTITNAAVVCPAGDPDLGFINEAVRHRARHHPVHSNYHLGVELIRGLDRFLHFEQVLSVGVFSPQILSAIARSDAAEGLRLQAQRHGAPVQAANISAASHVEHAISEADAWRAMDVLEATRGGVVNDHLAGHAPANA